MKKHCWIPISGFFLAFMLVPMTLLSRLEKMPGDIGDARLNNYFLENIYQFFSGGADSLWNLSFFAPFPYVLGFSDNLFGSSPVYILSRLFIESPQTSFQIWFYIGYACNFAAAYYALRQLKGSVLASTVGALIFAFALPTSAHAGHAQLHYRFGLPLAIVFLVHFYNSNTWRYLLTAFAWLVWQFYAGVYIGFFTLLLMATMSLAYFGSEKYHSGRSIRDTLRPMLLAWRGQNNNQRMQFWIGLAIIFSLLILLFYPYLQVSNLYGAKRYWDEISAMLPRLQSYFLADGSLLWSNVDASVFSVLPMRHEHQMFIGLIPLTLALVGFWVGCRAKNGANFTLMAGMLGLTMLFTLNIGGLSFWYLVHKLPLASAIRAMTRIDQALLFPMAYLAVIAIDDFKARFSWGVKAICVVLVPLFVIEAGMTSISSSDKTSWKERIVALEAIVPKNIPDGSILFFAQRSGPPFADELDAMWVAQKLGMKTINGYSGLYPPDYRYEYGQDCSEISKRIHSYLSFNGLAGHTPSYQKIMSSVVPVGFVNCESVGLKSPDSTTIKTQSESPDTQGHPSMTK